MVHCIPSIIVSTLMATVIFLFLYLFNNSVGTVTDGGVGNNFNGRSSRTRSASGRGSVPPLRTTAEDAVHSFEHKQVASTSMLPPKAFEGSTTDAARRVGRLYRLC